MDIAADSLSTLLSRLPDELLLAILQVAVDHADRHTVISIAQSSKLLYALAAPVLYFSIVLNDSNQLAIQPLLNNPTAARHIRSILAINRNWSPETEQCMNLVGVKMFSGFPMSMVHIYEGLPTPTRMSVKTFLSWNTTMLNHSPLHTAMQPITHLGLFISYTSAPFLTSVQDWLDATPLVNRLSFEVISHGIQLLPNTFPTMFSRELREMLNRPQNRRLRHVYIRLASGVPATGPEYRNALATIHPVPAQIWLWQDERVITDHSEDERICIEDALAGRYAFIMGTPVLPLQ